MKECPECLGEGYIQCPNCDGEGFIEEEPEQLELPGVEWSKYETHGR
jgi:hypothetical protein